MSYSGTCIFFFLVYYKFTNKKSGKKTNGAYSWNIATMLILLSVVVVTTSTPMKLYIYAHDKVRVLI